MQELQDVQEIFTRFWTDLISRPNGPYAFRFLLQPVMGIVLAVLDGIKDAKTGRSPFLWTILSDPIKRPGRLREGLKRTTRIILLGLVLEGLYQFKMFGTFYINEALVIIFLLAILPYLLTRGTTERIARHWLDKKHKR